LLLKNDQIMSATFQTFNDLHQSTELFILPNAWNAKSAIVFQEKGFPAIATSSAAVAGSLGYLDGEGMPFDDYLFVINRILSSVQIPLSVDMEMGYGTSDEEIYAHILTLAGMGVAGINIEDSMIDRSGRVLKESKLFAGTIGYIKNKLVSASIDLFINARCDTYLLSVENKRQETSRRVKLYEAAGADGIFLPCICNEDDISAAVRDTALPLNVMYIPELPDMEQLQLLGVKRVSMGPFSFNKIYDNIDIPIESKWALAG
jgi:2-methylisocitrate lyase-like PEP mutase family enzyme